MSSVDFLSLRLLEGKPEAGDPSTFSPTAAGTGWTPLSLPGLKVWHDASDTSSITQSGGFVSQWKDKSGNNNHITQGTGANQPATGANNINGLNVITFDGVNDLLTNSSFAGLAQPLTILMVIRIANTALGRIMDSAIGGANRIIINYTTNWSIYAGSNLIDGASDTSSHQLVDVFNGASSAIYLGGTSIASGNPGGSGFNFVYQCGGDTSSGIYYAGDIGELVTMSGSISAGDRTSWNTYCARWGL